VALMFSAALVAQQGRKLTDAQKRGIQALRKVNGERVQLRDNPSAKCRDLRERVHFAAAVDDGGC